MTRLLVSLAIVSALAAAACATPAVDGPPPFKVDHDTSAKEDDEDKTGDDDDNAYTGQPTTDGKGTETKTAPTPSADVTPVSSSFEFHGTVSRTPAVPFGGNGYCDYQESFSNITVSLTVDSKGRVTKSIVTANTVETTTASCTATARGSETKSFAYPPAGLGPTPGLTVPYGKSSSNGLDVVLTLTGTKVDDKKMHATLLFQRTDQGADLNWTVKTEIDLVRQ